MIICPSYSVKVKDTTSAGDTFTGFFFAAIARGESVAQAMDLAAKAASVTISRQGAAPSIPKLEEIE